VVGHQVVVVVGRGGLYKRIHKQQTDFGPRFSIPIEMSVMTIRFLSFCLGVWTRNEESERERLNGKRGTGTGQQC